MANRVITVVCGHVVADADVTDKTVKFRIAINRGVKNRETGEWEDKPMFLRCTDWLTTRSDKLVKGCLVQVTGDLTWDERAEGGFWAPELKVMDVSVLKWAQGAGEKNTNKQAAQGKRKTEDLPF